MYKIVNRHFGQTAYYFETEEEAQDLLCWIVRNEGEKHQWYVREMINVRK